MKKILLASTALVLSAGIANAQAVSITGEGRMGIQYDSMGCISPVTGLSSNGGSNYRIENRLTLNFNVAVEADHGLSFGAFTRARMQMGGGAAAVFAANQTGVFSGSRVWVEANGLRLTFGNQDGAIQTAGVAMGYFGGCAVGYEGGQQCGDSAGLLSVSHLNISTGAAGGQRAQLTYTMGDMRFALSHDRGGATEIGIRGTFDAFTVALGWSNNSGSATWVAAPAPAGPYAPIAALGGARPTGTLALSGRYNGGSWTVGALVARVTTSAAAPNNSFTNYSVSASAALGGGNLYGYVGRAWGNGTYGLNYGYGLGGGATLMVGAERTGGTANLTTASVGVAFTF